MVTCMHATITILNVHTCLIYFNKIYKNIKERYICIAYIYSKVYDILHKLTVDHTCAYWKHADFVPTKSTLTLSLMKAHTPLFFSFTPTKSVLTTWSHSPCLTCTSRSSTKWTTVGNKTVWMFGSFGLWIKYIFWLNG